MLLSSFLCATIIYGLFLSIATLLNRLFSKEDPDVSSVKSKTESISGKAPKKTGKAFAMANWISIVSGFLSSLLATMIVMGMQSLILRGGAALQPNWHILVITVVLSIVIIYLSFNPQRVKWFAICLTLILVVAISASLFIQPIYSRFLSVIRYGGGVEVNITSIDEKGQIADTKGALFLTTSNKYILYIASDSRFLEVTKSKVIKFSYSTQAKLSMPSRTK